MDPLYEASAEYATGQLIYDFTRVPSENATCWGAILLVVTTQPTQAPRFAHMARAITIGCFVVEVGNLRPRTSGVYPISAAYAPVQLAPTSAAVASTKLARP